MNVLRGDVMRGLHVFIGNIRNCKSTEEERNRINKELSHIRSKFRGDKILDGYNKKKYVCKLVYIYLLGYNIDFGHMEAINLLSSIKYSEKQIGYLFLTILWTDTDEFSALLVQAIKADFNSKNPTFVSLAMECVANIGSKDMAIHLGKGIPLILTSPDTDEKVKQTCALCLLTLLRKHPNDIQIEQEVCSKIYHFLNCLDLGVLTATISLICQMAKMNYINVDTSRSLAINRLSQIMRGQNVDMQDYTYYFIPAPWVCVKLFELLQLFPPPDDLDSIRKLTEVLELVLKKASDTEKSTKVQHSNAKYSIIFEAINLILHLDCLPTLVNSSTQLLARHLKSKDPNMRFLAMESLALLSTSEYSRDIVKTHRSAVIDALNTENDVSIRKRCIDLLYAMCDQDNVVIIIDNMLNHLTRSDFSLKSSIVLKISILAEKYRMANTWYIDKMMKLIAVAGDFVNDEVWNKFLQVIVNNEDIQEYTAKCVFEALDDSMSNETMIKVGSYILGEFGNKIAGSLKYSPEAQLSLLESKFPYCRSETRQLMLTTYAKLGNTYDALTKRVILLLTQDLQSRSGDIEIQQRAIEYAHLLKNTPTNLINTVFDEMPPFAERKSSDTSKEMTTTIISSGSNFSENKPEKNDLLNFSPGVDLVKITESQRDVQTDRRESILDMLHFDDDLIDTKALCDVDTVPEIEGDHKMLLYNASAVVYDDEYIQVGLKTQYNKNNGRFLLAIGNKSRFTVDLIKVVDLDDSLNRSDVIVDKISLASEIPPSSQISSQQKVHLESLFYKIFRIQLSFRVDGKEKSVLLYLPVFISYFLSKYECSNEVFNEMWNNSHRCVMKSIERTDKHDKTITQILDIICKFGFHINEGESYNCSSIIPVQLSPVYLLMKMTITEEILTISLKCPVDRLTNHLVNLLDIALKHYLQS